MTPGQRLRRARSARGLTPHQLAEASGHTYSAVRAHENGQNGIRPDIAEDYARVLDVSPEWILFGERKAESSGARMVPVVGFVQAGVWSEANEQEPTEHVPLADPRYFRAQNVYALELRGTSMNKLYTPPGYVIVVDAVEAGVREGDHAVVRRTRNGLVETTLKEVVVNGGQVELWPRSTDPRFQDPIVFTGSDETRIIGVVVGAYKKGPERTGPLVL